MELRNSKFQIAIGLFRWINWTSPALKGLLTVHAVCVNFKGLTESRTVAQSNPARYLSFVYTIPSIPSHHYTTGELKTDHFHPLTCPYSRALAENISSLSFSLKTAAKDYCMSVVKFLAEQKHWLLHLIKKTTKNGLTKSLVKKNVPSL